MTATVPTALHVGPFTLYLYGIGLGIAAYVTYGYIARRLRHHGLDITPWPRIAAWTIVSGVVGARIAHVATNWTFYHHAPAQIVAIWHGGLSSFGGIAGALPIGLFLARRQWSN